MAALVAAACTPVPRYGGSSKIYRHGGTSCHTASVVVATGSIVTLIATVSMVTLIPTESVVEFVATASTVALFATTSMVALVATEILVHCTAEMIGMCVKVRWPRRLLFTTHAPMHHNIQHTRTSTSSTRSSSNWVRRELFRERPPLTFFLELVGSDASPRYGPLTVALNTAHQYATRYGPL